MDLVQIVTLSEKTFIEARKELVIRFWNSEFCKYLLNFGKVLFQMMQGFFCSNKASRSFEISNVRLPSDEDETSKIPETVDAIRERWCKNIPTIYCRLSEFWKPMP